MRITDKGAQMLSDDDLVLSQIRRDQEKMEWECLEPGEWESGDWLARKERAGVWALTNYCDSGHLTHHETLRAAQIEAYRQEMPVPLPELVKKYQQSRTR